MTPGLATTVSARRLSPPVREAVRLLFAEWQRLQALDAAASTAAPGGQAMPDAQSAPRRKHDADTHG